MAKGGRKASGQIQYVPVIIPSDARGRAPSRAVIERAVLAASQKQATAPQRRSALSVLRKTKKARAKKPAARKPSADGLNAELDAYMGDDAQKQRLDTELDSYFAEEPAAKEAGEIA